MLQSFRSARNISSGTRFFRNALQVNPYEYIVRHGVQKGFRNESVYNVAMINACRENDIEAIAVTDHFRVKNSQQLSQAAKDAGIIVFPGFEAVSKDGVHLLCLSDPSTEPDQLERILVECGIYPQSGISPPASTWQLSCWKTINRNEKASLSQLMLQATEDCFEHYRDNKKQLLGPARHC